MLRCVARYLLQLNEFNITAIAIRGPEKSSMLAFSSFSLEITSYCKKPVVEEFYSLEVKEWRLIFDGASTHRNGRAGVVSS